MLVKPIIHKIWRRLNVKEIPQRGIVRSNRDPLTLSEIYSYLNETVQKF